MIDLAGRTFGHLTVIERYIDESKRSKWKCICDCGNEVISRSDSLTRGDSTSCGKGIHSPRFNDLSGCRYGKLTVNKLSHFSNNSAYWECICDCGTICCIESGNLVTGNSKTCGCSKTDYEDLSGKVFGDLKVIGRVNSDKKKVYYECMCKCGNRTTTRADGLLNGSVHSCGCSHRSLASMNITRLLVENGIAFSQEVCFADLKSPNGGSLRYDFAILDTNNQIVRLVEYDGIQHVRAIDGWWGGQDGWDYRRACDQLKNDYALTHRIPLVRIPHTVGNNVSMNDIFGDKYII